MIHRALAALALAGSLFSLLSVFFQQLHAQQFLKGKHLHLCLLG